MKKKIAGIVSAVLALIVGDVEKEELDAHTLEGCHRRQIAKLALAFKTVNLFLHDAGQLIDLSAGMFGKRGVFKWFVFRINNSPGKFFEKGCSSERA